MFNYGLDKQVGEASEKEGSWSSFFYLYQQVGKH